MTARTKSLNPFFWLLPLLLVWALLAGQHFAPKTASGQNSGLETASIRLTLWKAAPRLGFQPAAENWTAGDSVGAKGGTLLDELAANGVKFSPEKVIATGRSPSGQVVFLESGNSAAGLEHILSRHATDFANKGISASEIPSVVMQAVTEGRLVGTNGSAPVFEIVHRGVTQYISVGVGSNGYIVRANPVSAWKPLP